jgi:cytochrome P450
MAEKIIQVPLLKLLLRLKQLKKDTIAEVSKLHDEYGEIFCVPRSGTQTVMLKNPSHIKHVLIDNYTNYEKGMAFSTFHPLVKKGLLTIDGKRWVSDRKVIKPEFLSQSFEGHQKYIFSELDELVNRWSKREEVNFTDEICEFILKGICKILFQYDLDWNCDDIRSWLEDYTNFVGRQQSNIIKIPYGAPVPYIIKARSAAAKLTEFAQHIINTQMQRPGENMIKRMKQADFTEEEMRHHIITLFVAGHDTTANTLNFLFLLLRDHPQQFSELKEKIRNTSGEVTNQELSQIDLLNNIIKETLRLYPAVPVFARMVKEDDLISGQYIVKAKDMIAISPWAVHRSESYWKNALEFRPERFQGLDLSKNYHFFPFGFGPRKCIGSELSFFEMRAIVFTILRHFDFSITGQKDREKYKHNISLSPLKDVFLKKLVRVE